MDGMYSKLHDKYTKLKSQKEAEAERINLDQEVKFMDYKEAADELIEHLRNENHRVRSKYMELKSEMASLSYLCRSSRADQDQHGEPTGSRNEDNVRDPDLRNERFHHNSGEDKIENSKSVMSQSRGVESDAIDILASNSKRKRCIGSTPVELDPIDILNFDSTRNSSRPHETAEVTKNSNDHAPERDSLGTGSHIHQPACCRRTQDLSGNTVNVGGACNCVFQDLIEHLLGMKLSADIQADGISLLALHQSSGYSFKLTFVDKFSGGAVELMYNPISLGTFEMGAPEWMKEEIIFSMLMSPIFFERVLCVIK